MAVPFRDKLNGCYAFFFGLMCEHRAEGAVTDDTDMWQFGAVFLIDDNTALLVSFKAYVFKTEAGGVGSAADSYEDYVRIKLDSHGPRQPAHSALYLEKRSLQFPPYHL